MDMAVSLQVDAGTGAKKTGRFHDCSPREEGVHGTLLASMYLALISSDCCNSGRGQPSCYCAMLPSDK